MLQSESHGQPLLSPAGVPQSLLIAVPSALWPSKLSHEAYLNPAQAETDSFGLQQINFLSGLPGMYAGFLAPSWLITFLAFLGLACGLAERFLLGRRSPAQMVMLAAAVSAALTYEAGLPAMLVSIRTGVALALAVKILSAVTSRLTGVDASSGRLTHPFEALVGTSPPEPGSQPLWPAAGSRHGPRRSLPPRPPHPRERP
jgi:hypothetical protein